MQKFFTQWLVFKIYLFLFLVQSNGCKSSLVQVTSIHIFSFMRSWECSLWNTMTEYFSFFPFDILVKKGSLKTEIGHTMYIHAGVVVSNIYIVLPCWGRSNILGQLYYTFFFFFFFFNDDTLLCFIIPASFYHARTKRNYYIARLSFSLVFIFSRAVLSRTMTTL